VAGPARTAVSLRGEDGRGGMSKLHTVSLVDALAATLRRRVLDGGFDPGAGLTEQEVAADYDVSRPTAKTAITTLVQEGLLRREPHKTAHVPQLFRADVEDLFLVRIPLEIGVVALLVADPSAGSALADAARAVTDLAAVPEGAPTSDFVDADLGFHRALVAAVGSPRLTRLYAGLSGEIHLSMVQTRWALGRDRIVAEHQGVLDALRAGDGARAGHLMQTHLEGACAALTATMRDPDPG